METWKPVVGYEGLYEVSDLGNVRSLNWKNKGYARNLYLKPHNKGYLQVELFNNGIKKMLTVHRLVAEAFIPNPNCYPQVNHKDENKRNNKSENLEWCTSSYNATYSMELHPDRASHKYYKSTEKYNRRNDKEVNQFSLSGEFIKTWNNSREIYTTTGMSDWSISECCRGNRKKAYGFMWSYST